MLQQAIALHQKGRLAEAGTLYRNILAQDPENADALHLLGVIEAQQNNASAGVELIERAIRLRSNNPGFFFSHGNALGALARFDAALSSYDRALAIKPDYPEALNNRGNALQELKRFDDALASYDRALAIKPNYAEALNNRGNTLQELNRLEEALASYDHALQIEPNHGHALVNRGLALRGLKRFDEAVATYDRALAIKPDHPEALSGRGIALKELKRLEEALECFDKALALRPDLEAASIAREMTLLELGRLKRFPASSARGLFDDFSSRYDETMLGQLGYRGHIHVRTLADRVLPRRTLPWRILDLGMGTGLVGEAFKDLAVGGRLDGIDLAPRMIEAARARNIYDDLVLGDIETVLAAPGPSYDLILSADTMIYIGELALTFAGVAGRLVPGGFYIFACESKQGDGWERTPANRFRHSQSYLRTEAARAGLDFVDITDCVLRYEAGRPVQGFAVALRKP